MSEKREIVFENDTSSQPKILLDRTEVMKFNLPSIFFYPPSANQINQLNALYPYFPLLSITCPLPIQVFLVVAFFFFFFFWGGGGGVGCYFYSSCNRTLCKRIVETLDSDLGLHSLHMSHKKDDRHIWVKFHNFVSWHLGSDWLWRGKRGWFPLIGIAFYFWLSVELKFQMDMNAALLNVFWMPRNDFLVTFICFGDANSQYMQSLYRQYKSELFEALSKVFKWQNEMTLCNNNNQTWFSDTLTSARPLGVVIALLILV